MFGNNPIRSKTTDPLRLAVEEIFYTLQGEGPYAGCPALFIRLAGCNLACHFCDTQFETQAENLRTLSGVADNIVTNFSREKRKLVVLTGGEPLLQDAGRLLEFLFKTGTEMVQIETAGTIWQDYLYDYLDAGRVHLVCSPKTPGIHFKIAEYCTDWKYIISAGEIDPDDGLPNRGTQTRNRQLFQRIYRPQSTYENPEHTIWLSPCDLQDAELNRVNMELARDLCLKHGYRLSLQLHKMLGLR